MPTLTVKNANQVPAFRKLSQATIAQQQTYEGFIREAGTSNAGELSLDDGEQIRSVKVRLRRAATRLGSDIEIWDADGKVYFKSAGATARRGRPRKS